MELDAEFHSSAHRNLHIWQTEANGPDLQLPGLLGAARQLSHFGHWCGLQHMDRGNLGGADFPISPTGTFGPRTPLA